VWQQAQSDARAQLAARQIPGFLTQAIQPQALLTPEEAAMRVARTPVQQGGQRVVLDPKVTQKLQDALSKQGPTAVTPPELLKPVQDAVTQLWGDQPPDIITFYLQDGRLGPVNTARELVGQAQIMANPLAAGYSGGGSPEESRLEEMLSAYNNPGALVGKNLSPAAQRKLTEAYSQYSQMPAAFQKKLLADHSPTGYWLQQALTARDNYKAANPLLGQYLDYLASTGGTGNKKEFLERYFSRP
jgi:hypothetical protein